jgi:hypothetical protein
MPGLHGEAAARPCQNHLDDSPVHDPARRRSPQAFATVTDRHWQLVGFATLWLLVLAGIWVSWRWAATVFVLLCLLGLVRRARLLPPSPRSPDRKP